MLHALGTRDAGSPSGDGISEIVDDTDRGSNLENFLIRQMVLSLKVGEKEIEMSLQRTDRLHMRPVVGSVAHAAMSEGEERGERRGIKRGKEMGRMAGKAEMLLRVLRLRFGDLPEQAVARVRKASGDDLDFWAEQVFSANSLDNVLLNGKPS